MKKEELKIEIERGDKNKLKTDDNFKNLSKEFKSTSTCCLCKIEKIKDCFFKTGGLCKECSSEKITCPLCKILLNRSSL